MSTLRVDKISPFQSSSILIEGDVIQANAATTGSNTFVGNQIVSASNSVTTFGGNFIDLYADAGNFDTFRVEVAENEGLKMLDWDGASTQSFLEVDTLSGPITLFRNTNINGDLQVNGSLIATQYVVSSSVSHITSSFSSGSTIFGDSVDDTHQFTGSVLVDGNVTAASFTGSLSYTDLTDVPTLVSSSTQVTNLLPSGTVSGSSQVTNLLPAGTVSGSSQITYGDISSIPNGIISSSTQVLGYDIFTTTASFNSFTASATESVVTAIVTNNGSSYYIIDGVNQPKLSFAPGLTYRFDLSGIAGSHPFKFSTSPNGPTQYTTGVISGSGFIQIEIGYNTTTPLHYYCTNHSGMGNEINVLAIDELATTASFNEFTSSYNTGSFSGSFVGDGSGLTGIPGVTPIDSASFATTGSNVFIGNQIVTGSVTISGSISQVGVGSGNLLIGSAPLTNLTTGIANTIIGNIAGIALSTGGANTFVGEYAGGLNQVGSNNTFVGRRAGEKTTVGNNTFVGANAGNFNITGADNAFFGYYAGYNNSVASNNTFIGQSTGFDNTSGSGNTFVGKGAGENNTIANNNAFVGYNAGRDNVVGTSNTFVGPFAGQVNISGSSNTFIGASAGVANTQANDNTFVGQNAGSNNSVGTDNTFVGKNAGTNTTSGSGNSFFGRQAAAQNNTGANNSTFGLQAGQYNQSGSSNSFFGKDAGTFLGNGSSENSSADTSVFLGAETRASGSAQTNQIVIGYQAVGNGSNTATLGNDNITATHLKGDVVIDTATKGIDFSINTSGPGSTSQNLDWYEEGAYTYTVSGSTSGNWNPRSGYTTAAYTRIGRQVTVTGQIEIDSLNSPVGDAIFTLPYTASNSFEFRASTSVPLRGENPTTSGTIHAFVTEGEAYFKLLAVETGSSFTLGDTHLDAAWEFIISLTYFTNS